MSVLGIDLGIRKIAICVITDGLAGYTCYGVRTLVLVEQPREDELHRLSRYVESVALTYQPDHVFIEQPIVGNNRKYSMKISESCGAVRSVLGQEVHRGLKTVMVDNGTWKKELLHDGHASKAEVRNYINVTHPAYAAFCGDDQDAYDSCCIALYGVALLDRASHLSL